MIWQAAIQNWKARQNDKSGLQEQGSFIFLALPGCKMQSRFFFPISAGHGHLYQDTPEIPKGTKKCDSRSQKVVACNSAEAEDKTWHGKQNSMSFKGMFSFVTNKNGEKKLQSVKSSFLEKATNSHHNHEK